MHQNVASRRQVIRTLDLSHSFGKHHMLDLDKQDKQSILERIKKDFPDRLAEYASRKYPEEQYDRLLGIFGEPKRVTAGDIEKALVWKYGHWGKGNYPLKHHQLITNVQRSWDQFIEQPYHEGGRSSDISVEIGILV